MKLKGLTALFLILMLIGASPITAQTQNTATAEVAAPNKPVSKMPKEKTKPNKEKSKVSTEFGLGVGGRYNWFQVMPISANFSPKMDMQWSGGAAFQIRVNIGRSFGIQPEISYARSRLKIKDSANNFTENAKSNLLQVPLLFSFRIAMFRLNFGPVFRLMDDTTYMLQRVDDDSYQQMHLGSLTPIVTYTAGISVRFAKIMMIDVRYADQFKDIKSNNEYIWTLDKTKQSEATQFRTRSRSIQLRLGVAF
jgi:hypothetical protein